MTTGDELSSTNIICVLSPPNWRLRTKGSKNIISTKSKSVYDVTIRVEDENAVDLSSLVDSVEISTQLRVY